MNRIAVEKGQELARLAHADAVTHGVGRQVHETVDALSPVLGVKARVLGAAMVKALRSIPDEKRLDAVQELAALLLEPKRAARIRGAAAVDAVEGPGRVAWAVCHDWLADAWRRGNTLRLRRGADDDARFPIEESLEEMAEQGDDVEARESTAARASAAVLAQVAALPSSVRRAAEHLVAGIPMTGADREALRRYRSIHGRTTTYTLPVTAPTP